MSLDQCRLIFEEMTQEFNIKNGTLGDEGMCRIRLKEDWMPPLNFCYIDASDSLLIFSEAGPIPSEKEATLIKQLMYRQFLFENSKGVTFSLAKDNMALTVQLRLEVSSLNKENLIEALDNFVNEVRLVRVEMYKDDENQFEKASNSDSYGLNNILID